MSAHCPAEAAVAPATAVSCLVSGFASAFTRRHTATMHVKCNSVFWHTLRVDKSEDKEDKCAGVQRCRVCVQLNRQEDRKRDTGKGHEKWPKMYTAIVDIMLAYDVARPTHISRIWREPFCHKCKLVRFFVCVFTMGWPWVTDLVVNAGGLTSCRYDYGCWCPLCPYWHSGGG